MPASVDPSQKPATAARMYDYFLGGTHNFPADREAAHRVMEQNPNAPAWMRANRAFVRRAVRYLAGQAGVRQFLDLGSGIPTEGNVHEIAQAEAPDARVMYVDLDPVAVAESMEMLEGNPTAVAIRADLREPDSILAHPQLRELFDFTQPVALIMAAVVHFIPDDAQAYALVERLVTVLPAGSYLLLSHGASEAFTHAGDNLEAVRSVYDGRTATPGTTRDHKQVLRLFTGLELIDPGVVWTTQWRPTPDMDAEVTTVTHAVRSGIWCGLGRKS